VIVRGPSASGKSTVAHGLRGALGRGVALVQQDVMRREVLREWDLPGGVAPSLMAANARMALDAGFDVVIEGIMHAERYHSALMDLIKNHQGRTGVFFLDVSYSETLRRHAERPQAADFGVETLQKTWADHDVLGVPGEHVVNEATSLPDTLELILSQVFADRRGPEGFRPSAAAVREAQAAAAATC
jgi:predicted kinase